MQTAVRPIVLTAAELYCLRSQGQFHFPAHLQRIIPSTCIRRQRIIWSGLQLSLDLDHFASRYPWTLGTEQEESMLLVWSDHVVPQKLSLNIFSKWQAEMSGLELLCVLYLLKWPSTASCWWPWVFTVQWWLEKTYRGEVCWCVYLASVGDLLFIWSSAEPSVNWDSPLTICLLPNSIWQK